MPWGDRTGPLGQGPMTGRGMGYCGGFGAPGAVTAPGRGRGWWRCFGGWFGGGFRRRFRWFWRMPFFAETPQAETEILKREAEILKRELEAVEKRLSELEKKE